MHFKNNNTKYILFKSIYNQGIADIIAVILFSCELTKQGKININTNPIIQYKEITHTIKVLLS